MAKDSRAPPRREASPTRPAWCAGTRSRVELTDPISETRGTTRLSLRVHDARPIRRRVVRGLRLQPDLGPVQDELPDPQRPQPRDLGGRDRLLPPPAAQRPLVRREPRDPRPAARTRWTSSTATRCSSRPSTCGSSEIDLRRLRARPGRGRVHRQHERSGASDPLLHRRQQRPADPARATSTTSSARTCATHLRVHADPRGDVVPRLLAGGERHDLPQPGRTRRRHDRRRPRHGPPASPGGPVLGAGHRRRRARSTSSTASRPTSPRSRVTGYYYDDSTPDAGHLQCSGDAAAYGSSGSWVTSPIPNTDPQDGRVQDPGGGPPRLLRRRRTSRPRRAPLRNQQITSNLGVSVDGVVAIPAGRRRRRHGATPANPAYLQSPPGVHASPQEALCSKGRKLKKGKCVKKKRKKKRR